MGAAGLAPDAYSMGYGAPGLCAAPHTVLSSSSSSSGLGAEK